MADFHSAIRHPQSAIPPTSPPLHTDEDPMIRSLLTVAALLGAAPLSLAAKVKVWHQNKPVDFDRAQLTQTVVTSEGSLRLSRQMKPLAGLEATHVWAMAEDKNGNLYIATGDTGKVFKVGADGKAV